MCDICLHHEEWHTYVRTHFKVQLSDKQILFAYHHTCVVAIWPSFTPSSVTTTLVARTQAFQLCQVWSHCIEL